MNHWTHETTRLTSKAAETTMEFFPDGTSKMFIINAPWIFKAIYAVAKGSLDELTRKKVHIMGKDYMPTLLKHIDLD